MAERSYPSPKVRGGDRECLAASAQEQPRGATPHLRSGAVAESARLRLRRSGQPRSGAAAERSNPTSKEWWLRGYRRAERSYSTFKIRRGDLVQGKEQQLRFAGAAMRISHVQGKRNPSKMVGVARGHHRADTLKP